jgi:hypothetical protein
VDGDADSRLLFVLVEKVRHLLYRFVVTGVSTAKDDINANGIFIDIFHGLLGVKPILALNADWYEAAFNLEVTCKLFKSDLGIRTHDDVGARLMDRFAVSLATLLPASLHGQTTQLYSFR